MDYIDANLLRNMVVGISEVSKITNIPVRKLRYWQEKGIIESVNDSSTRQFNYMTIKKIILIQELLEEGYTLDASVKRVEKRMDKLNAAFNELTDYSQTEKRK